MVYVRWFFRIIVFVVVAATLHYTLPQRDIVQILNTEVRRVDFGANSIFWANSGAGDAVDTVNRDVLFIEAQRPNGSTSVYRNEDTGWGWPPYFKFDTADLQARARVFITGTGEDQWVAIRHYGWRSQLFSIFPNAVSIDPVEGPDVRLIPWFNIIFLTLGGILWLSLWRLWRNFRSHRIDPLVDDLDARGDRARGRISRWFSGR